MKRKKKKIHLFLTVSLFLIVSIGLSFIVVIEKSSIRMIEIYNDLNFYVDDAVYFSYFRGYGEREYEFFVQGANNFIRKAHLKDILASEEGCDVTRLTSYTVQEHPDIILGKLRRIQVHMGNFLVGQRKASLLLIGLFCGILMVIAILLLISGLSKVNQLNTEIIRSDLHKNLLDTMERDRNLISFELHDDLAQKLALINRFFLKPDLKDENLHILKKYSEEAIQQVRLVSNRLKTPVFDKMTLKDSFFQLFSDYKILTGINLDYKIIGFSNLSLSEEVAINVYRVIQELLNNALKHSRAAHVSFILLYGHPELIIRYKDDGVGFDPRRQEAGGSGLDSIRFRMELLKARWDLQSSEGSGVKWNIRIPVI